MRIKEFNTDEVVEKAVILFWRQGYEATSMKDLVDTMGINRQSMYDTFGNKHHLFILALQKYFEITKEEITTKLADETDLASAIVTVFNVYVHREGSTPAGCMIVDSATELGLTDTEVHDQVTQYFDTEKMALKQLLEEFKSELASNTDIEALAGGLQNTLVGIRVQARISDPQIDLVIQNTIKSLPWRN